MSAKDFPVSTSSPTYCTAEDVSRIWQRSPFSQNVSLGDLSTDDINDIILDAEEVVDQHTGHAWRERQVTEEYPEFRNITTRERHVPAFLNHRSIRDLDSGQGDKVEVYLGSWEDFLTTQTEGRGDDFWVQYTDGIIFIQRRIWRTGKRNKLRVTYRYGETTVPRSVKVATAMLAASDIAISDVIVNNTGESGVDRVRNQSKAERWEQRAYARLQPHVEAR